MPAENLSPIIFGRRCRRKPSTRGVPSRHLDRPADHRQESDRVAEKEGADAVCHGATGKGNDQVRFELTFKALMPHVKVIAPWREWDMKSREDEIAYAERHSIPVPVTKSKPYSSDRNLWHMSFEGGILENPDKPPREDMFVLRALRKRRPHKPEVVTIDFEKGIPVRINGKKLDPVKLVETPNSSAASTASAGSIWWKIAWWG